MLISSLCYQKLWKRSTIYGTVHPIHFIRNYLIFEKKMMCWLFKLFAIIYLFSGRAMDIIFDGVAADCTSQHAITRGVCGQFKDNPQFVEVEPGLLKFSLIGTVSSTVPFFYSSWKNTKIMSGWFQIFSHWGCKVAIKSFKMKILEPIVNIYSMMFFIEMIHNIWKLIKFPNDYDTL